MNCYGFKGGTGTASRVVAIGSNDLSRRSAAAVQLRLATRADDRGRADGAALAADNPLEDDDWFTAGTGSVIGIVVTDAPLLPGQCKALARRVPLGLARTGTTGWHFSGDLFLALSTANRGAFGTGSRSAIPPIPWSGASSSWTGSGWMRSTPASFRRPRRR